MLSENQKKEQKLKIEKLAKDTVILVQIMVNKFSVILESEGITSDIKTTIKDTIKEIALEHYKSKIDFLLTPTKNTDGSFTVSCEVVVKD